MNIRVRANGRRASLSLCLGFGLALVAFGCTVEIPPDEHTESTYPYDPPGDRTGDETGDTPGDETSVVDPTEPSFKPVASPTVATPEGVSVSVDVGLADEDIGLATITAVAVSLDDDANEVIQTIDELPGASSFDFDKTTGIATVQWSPAYTVVEDVRGDAMYTLRFTAAADGDQSLAVDEEVTIDVRNDLDQDGDADIDDGDIDDDGINNEFETGGPGSTEEDDPDSDGDGFCDGDGNPAQSDCEPGDNCPTAANETQADPDGDGVGAPCDACPQDDPDDSDGDGFCDSDDNCPLEHNDGQEDDDEDDIGNACDDWPGDPNNDQDNDDVPEPEDNCPTKANPFQEDDDEDLVGNECDVCPFDADDDGDGDGYCADEDNCPDIPNGPDQAADPDVGNQKDTDGDDFGDACDSCVDIPGLDNDDDGVCGEDDNCPDVKNPQQQDSDDDDVGDACDPCPDDVINDPDEDDVCGKDDNCPFTANGPEQTQEAGVGNQTDTDEDDVGDACDICPFSPTDDSDSDEVCDDVDNCPTVKNGPNEDGADGNQANTDGDDEGDACDGDDDNDGDPDAVDNCPKIENPEQEDLDDDGEGDACDPDADGDFVDDDDDNCPGLTNPLQLDVDGDLVGVACDDKIGLPEELADSGAGEAVYGMARKDTVALAFVEALDCNEVSDGDCAAPGVFVLQEEELVTELDDWIDVDPSGRIAVPYVGQNGEVLLAAKPATSGFELHRITEGEHDDSVAGVSSNLVDLPTFEDLPVGSTLVNAGEKLFEVGPEGAGIQHQSGDDFFDSGGAGGQRDDSNTLYQPSRTGTNKYSLYIYTADGEAEKVLSSVPEIFYWTHDPISGSPWYCTLATGTTATPRLQLYDGVDVVAELEILGPGSCTDIIGTWLSDDGVWWLEMDLSPGGPSNNLQRWQVGEAAAATVVPGNSMDAEVHIAGNETYVSLATASGTTEAHHYNSFLSATVPLEWPCDALFGTEFVTSEDGWLAAVGRDSDAGTTGELIACRTQGTSYSSGALTLGPALVSSIKDLWIDTDGIVYIHATHGSFTSVSTYVAQGALVDVEQQFTTNGNALVSVGNGYAVVGIGGDDKGVYRLHLDGDQVQVAELADSLKPHDVLFDSDELDGAGMWIAYNTAGSSYELAYVDGEAFMAAGLSLKGPPISHGLHSAFGTPWFTYATDDGDSMAQITDGWFEPWREDLSELEVLSDAITGALWGARTLNAAGLHSVCKLPPDEACWPLPEDTDTLLWGPWVAPSDQVYAVLLDSAALKGYLWRNLAEPFVP